MADRRGLLERLMTTLSRPGVDGALGHPDVVEELLLLGGLEGEVVIGSINRGGLDGAAWTMDDRSTGYDAAGVRRAGSRAARCSPDRRRGHQHRAHHPRLARAVPARRAGADGDGRAAALHRDASGRLSCARTPPRWPALDRGLGARHASASTWLKIPRATAGGRVQRDDAALRGARRRPRPDPRPTWRPWRRTLRQDAVRGLVIGRSLLYPPIGTSPGRGRCGRDPRQGRL